MMSRPQFGSRHLSAAADVFSENAWDDVTWSDEQLADARRIVAEAHAQRMSDADAGRVLDAPHQHWDQFYSQHKNRFFQDRHWLFTEFGELAEVGSEDGEIREHSGCEDDRECEENSYDCDKSSAVYKSRTTSSSRIKANISFSQLEHATENLNISEVGEKNPAIRPNTVGDDCVSVSNGGVSVRSECGALRVDAVLAPGSRRCVWEIGCGAGNTVFPLLKSNPCRSLFVYASDYSQQAVSIVRQSPHYEPERCHVFLNDITDAKQSLPFPPGSIHCIVLIFVLSAIEHCRHGDVAQRLVRHLAPGGVILFRDYGRYDMAELRFKRGRCLGENSYARGDGTLVHFFTQESVRRLFVEAGLCELQNIADRRLQVNRGRQLKMYRVWIQAKYRKPSHADQPGTV